MGDDQHILMHILEYKYGGNVIFEGWVEFFKKKIKPQKS
jgi:hypothetical protein